jgi:hypothetical protein
MTTGVGMRLQTKNVVDGFHVDIVSEVRLGQGARTLLVPWVLCGRSWTPATQPIDVQQDLRVGLGDVLDHGHPIILFALCVVFDKHGISWMDDESSICVEKIPILVF